MRMRCDDRSNLQRSLGRCPCKPGLVHSAARRQTSLLVCLLLDRKNGERVACCLAWPPNGQGKVCSSRAGIPKSGMVMLGHTGEKQSGGFEPSI